MVLVHDLQKKKAYETNTRNVCAQRDFMRFEAKDRKPDWLEEEFSKLESVAMEAIREVIKTKDFDGKNRNSILNLMALLAVRSPEQRENMRQFHERVARGVMNLVLADKERWQSEVEQLEEATGQPPLVTYEEAKEFHERGEYTIEIPRERHIQTEVDLYKTLLQFLGERKWTLYLVPGDYGEFVTTNRPVVIAYTHPEKVPPFLRHSPGFGLKDTEVYFPLTKHAFLIGRWDGEEKATVNSVDQPFVGVMNNLMIQHSYGLVLSSTREVLYHDPLMRLQWDDMVIDRFTVPPSAEEIGRFKAEHGIVDAPEAGPKE